LHAPAGGRAQRRGAADPGPFTEQRETSLLEKTFDEFVETVKNARKKRRRPSEAPSPPDTERQTAFIVADALRHLGMDVPAGLLKARGRKLATVAEKAEAEECLRLIDLERHEEVYDLVLNRFGKPGVAPNMAEAQRLSMEEHTIRLLGRRMTASVGIEHFGVDLPECPAAGPPSVPVKERAVIIIAGDGSRKRCGATQATAFACVSAEGKALVGALPAHCTNNLAEAFAYVAALCATERWSGSNVEISFLSDSAYVFHNARKILSSKRGGFGNMCYPSVWSHAYNSQRRASVVKVKAHRAETPALHVLADRLADVGRYRPPGAVYQTTLTRELRERILSAPESEEFARELAGQLQWEEVEHGLVDRLLREVREDPLQFRRMNDECPQQEEVLAALKKLNRKAARGSDGTSLADVDPLELPRIAQAACRLFQEVWRTRKVPRRWGEVVLVYLQKDNKGPLSPSNSRGIALQQLSWKLFAKVINDRFDPPISDEQTAFRPQKQMSSSALTIRLVLDEMRREKDAGLSPGILFIDWRKAYDRVDRKALFLLLERYGMGPTVMQILRQAELDEIAIRFPDGTYSRTMHSTAGVRQGCPLSCMLFNVFLDPLVRFIKRTFKGYKGVKVAVYADDMAIPFESISEVQNMIDEIERFMEPLGMSINGDKTKIMAFHVLPGSGHADAQAYEAALRGQGKHKQRLPNYTRTAIDQAGDGGSTLLLPAGCSHVLGCPFQGCPYATKGLTAAEGGKRLGSSVSAMKKHLMSRHSMDCTTHAIIEGELPLPPRATAWPNRPRINPPWLMSPSFIWAGEEMVEFVTEFRHLGTIHDSTGKTARDREERVRKARGKYFSLARLWKHGGYPCNVKAAIFSAVIVPVLLAGIATSPDRAEAEDDIDRFYYFHLRSIAKMHPQPALIADDGSVIEWRRFSRDEVLTATGVPTLAALRRRERLNLLGLLLRAPVDSPWKTQPFCALMRSQHQDARTLWYARALSDIRHVAPTPLDVCEAHRKAFWNLATAKMVASSCACPTAKHALAPNKGAMDPMDDNDEVDWSSDSESEDAE
jgi:ribonuclease HI